MRNRKYPSTGRVRMRHPRKILAAALAVTALFAGSGFAGKLRRAEAVYLENGAYRWGTALLAECAEAGMEAADGPLIRTEQDTEGNVRMISVDAQALHDLRTEIIRHAETLLENGTVYTVKIPLGTVLASEFFSGVGPSVPFSYAPAGNVTVLCRSSLESAGINQTAYRVTLSMTMEVSAVTSFSRHQITVPYEIVVAESMVVGDVPAVYAYGAADSVGRKS